MAERQYRRLTRATSRSLFGIISVSRVSLWLGGQHLLQIETSGFTEAYKRFHFRDIQALVLCQTQTWIYYAAAFTALSGLFGFIAWIGGEPVLAWITGSLAGIFLLCLVLHLIAGPSCKTYIRSAVQTEALPSLNRLWRAQKVFATLRPLIIAAQGQLPPGMPATEAQGLPPVPGSASAPPPGLQSVEAPTQSTTELT